MGGSSGLDVATSSLVEQLAQRAGISEAVARIDDGAYVAFDDRVQFDPSWCVVEGAPGRARRCR
jgi:hypothetical protein